MDQYLSYMYEKLQKGIEYIDRQDGSLQKRLSKAYIKEIGNLQGRLMASKFQDRFEEIRTKLTSRKTAGNQGQVDATLNNMEDSTALEIANKIRAFYKDVEQEYSR